MDLKVKGLSSSATTNAGYSFARKLVRHYWKNGTSKMVSEGDFDLAVERSYVTAWQNSSLLPLLLMSLAIQKHTPDTTRFFKRRYDYIVVGAGSAGSVVAARLSEDPSKTVLLLEAGKSPPLLTDLPGAQPFFPGTDLDWNYSTVPQKYAALGHENRRVTSPVGKTLGGSSTINGMFYVRGNHKDYDDWADMGAYGWDWNSVFPYFLKPENNTDPDVAYNGFHSVCGPLAVGRYNSMSEFEEPLRRAAISMGFPYRDINGASQIGLAVPQGNLRNGQRVSTAKAYLVPIDDRPNLDIVTEAYATKVIIANKTAQGVQFDFEGSRYEVLARLEVSVSARALKTPQLLMLSGIGPRKTLEKFGIPVIADLPVGKNYHDHAGTWVNFFSTKDLPTHIEKLQHPNNIQRYIKYRAGPLAGVMNGFGAVFYSDNASALQSGLPEYEVYFFEGPWGPNAPNGLSQEVYDTFYGPYLNRSTIFCLVHELITDSTGYVSIRSGNPYDPPVIDPKIYQRREDLLRVIGGMKMCYRLMEHPFMKQFGYRPFETVMPGCEELDYDEYLECYARSVVVPVSHQMGTARMGDVDDPNTVVDTHLRVKGIKDLRVVDASVIPKIPHGNTNAAVIMIAERASEIIKGCH